MSQSKRTRTIVESGILISLAFALSLIQVPIFFGAQITFASTIPICILCLRQRKGWSFISAFIYSLLQLFVAIVRDGILGWGLIASNLFLCILLDYVFAFSCLGIVTFFKNKGKSGIFLGIFVAFFLRYLFHVLSGYLIFTNFEQFSLFGKIFENKALLYSISFNALFIIPEFIISAFVLLAIFKIPYLSKLIFEKK